MVCQRGAARALRNRVQVLYPTRRQACRVGARAGIFPSPFCSASAICSTESALSIILAEPPLLYREVLLSRRPARHRSRALRLPGGAKSEGRKHIRFKKIMPSVRHPARPPRVPNLPSNTHVPRAPPGATAHNPNAQTPRVGRPGASNAGDLHGGASSKPLQAHRRIYTSNNAKRSRARRAQGPLPLDDAPDPRGRARPSAPAFIAR